MKAQLICCENCTGDAVNVGGPVKTTYKNFDIELPEEVKQWILAVRGYKYRFTERFVIGVAIPELEEPTP